MRKPQVNGVLWLFLATLLLFGCATTSTTTDTDRSVIQQNEQDTRQPSTHVQPGGLSSLWWRTYQTRIQEHILKVWLVPPHSKGLQAVVFLTIDWAGHVERWRFVQRSGNERFDESIQQAIKQAEPFPSLPADYTERLLDAEIRFRPRE